MRNLFRGAACAALVAVLGSCSSDSVLNPSIPVDIGRDGAGAAEMPSVRFSEVHYDNDGTDAGESIEISGPAGTNVSGWRVILYNGSGGASYNVATLSGLIPDMCGPVGARRGVVTVTYPSNGIQNGSPDGMALVTNTNAKIEFLSYEGTFAATNETFTGQTSVDIGASQAATTPIGTSLQRNSSDVWSSAASTFGSCNDASVVIPPPPPPPPVSATVRINELHYDNDGTDSNEGVEIQGVAGTDLTGWRIILYNGSGGASYATYALSGIIPSQCYGQGTVSVSTTGIQNGSPDAVALVNAANAVVEFLSYEGTFAATNEAANGMTSVDIIVSESATSPVGHSLQRDSAGTWLAARPSNFGLCNNAVVEPPPPPPPVVVATLVINEIMSDPINAESASWGEWFEVHNYGTASIDMNGWTIESPGHPVHTIASTVVVPAGGYAVLGRGFDSARNGGLTLDYNYFTGGTTIFLDATDRLLLRNVAGALVDSVRWTSSLGRGATIALRDALVDNADVNGAAWGYSTVTFGAGDYGTPGTPNGTLATSAPAVFSITITGRSASGDPPLPVNYEDQLFATERNATGDVVPTTITWTSQTPAIATIDMTGVVRGVTPGTAVLRATATDGTTRTISLPVHAGTLSATALYAGNAEFGEPADGDASNDIIVRRAQFTSSWNPARNTPNWVSYNLEATHFGAEDRCDCFTHDDALPTGLTRISTSDYTGAGAFHGYGIDRGHLARSADRTSASLDNAATYLFTNIIPQAADVNQGPWALLENVLGNKAENQNREVYIITGIAGAKPGSLKGEGRIVIPSQVWKVAIIMPRDKGLGDVMDWTDVEVIAVLMPNDAGLRDAQWETFRTTVDAIEMASGYDLLALLPDRIERIIESGIRPPTARLNGPYSGIEGSGIAMSGAASTDADNQALSFSWQFGDGVSAVGSAVTHSYAQDGSYTVRLIVTDTDGLADTTTAVVAVANAAPVVTAISGATILRNMSYTAAGSFTDPGADNWTATVDYGDGSGVQALTLTGVTFALSHTYTATGTFTVTVRVLDGTATTATSATVIVQTALQGISGILALLDQMVADGRLRANDVNSLRAKLDAAQKSIEKGNANGADNQLGAFENQVAAIVQSGRLSEADGALLVQLAQQVRAAL